MISDAPFRRILNSIAYLGAAAVIFLTIARFGRFAPADWTGVKLAPVIGMLKEYRLYQDPATGVFTGWIYGPVSALILLPASLGKTPTACGYIGSVITFIFYMMPAIWLLWMNNDRRVTPLGIMALLVFAWAPMVMPDLESAAFLPSPDGPGIGLTACACALLHVRRGMVNMVLAALCAVLAVWTKQNFAPLIIGLVAWIWIEEGSKAAAIFSGITALVGLVVSAVLLASFGASNMYFHMVTLPASHPFRYHEYSRWAMWLANLGEFLPRIVACSALVAIVMLLDNVGAPSTSRPRWRMFVLIAICFVPGSFLGESKMGGGYNSTAGVNYFLLMAALCGIISIGNRIDDQSAWRGAIQSALAIVSIVLATSGLLHPPANEKGLWAGFFHPFDNPTERVYHFAIDHRERILCPENPLVTLLSEGKLYHTDTGLFDRMAANRLPNPAERFFDHMPRELSLLIYMYEPPSKYIENSLPNFRNQVQLPELPNCLVVTR